VRTQAARWNLLGTHWGHTGDTKYFLVKSRPLSRGMKGSSVLAEAAGSAVEQMLPILHIDATPSTRVF